MLADIKHFIEAVDKAKHQYFDDMLDPLKDVVIIPDIVVIYVWRH